MSAYDTNKLNISVFEFVDHRSVVATWEDFLAHRDESNRQFRVDISVRDSSGLHDLLSALHDDPLLTERCLDPNAVSGVQVYDNMLALQLPVANDWEASEHQKLTIFCLPNALVTVHANTLSSMFTESFTNMASQSTHPQTVEVQLFLLLDTIIDRASDLTLKARLAVDQLETAMQQAMAKEQIGTHILSLKRTVAHFEMALEAKHQTLTALLSLDAGPIDLHPVRESLRDVVAHIEHSLRYVERIEDRLTELDRHFLFLLQDRTNNRLRILTIISAIFMPLTLVAGIYGMNFRFMPELSWHYGYGVVLLLMAIIAIILIVYFYRKNWFR